MLKVSVMVVGPLSTNCYFVHDENRDLVIVDPGDWAGRLDYNIRESRLTPRAILLTHGHFDHIGAVDGLREKYPDLTVYACEKEKTLLEDSHYNGSSGMASSPLIMEGISYLADCAELDLLGEKWELISTPGHTAGSSCYYIAREGLLFAGDTLFAGGVGRTDLPTGSTADMVTSIRDVLMKLPDETKVFPGHGPATSIGVERRQNFIMQM